MSESDAKAATAGVREARDDAEMFEVQQLRAMEQPKWNEARLDDLNTKVDTGFARMERRFDTGFERMDQRFERVEQRLDRLMWSLFTAAVAIIVALIGAPHL